MLGTLIESGATHQRAPLASLLSISVHAGLIAGAVLATQQITTALTAPAQETIRYLAPPAPAAPVAHSTAVRLPRGFQILIAPVTIPDVLPPIDLARAATNTEMFTGVGVAGGVPDGVVGAPRPGTIWTDRQVDRIAHLVAGSGTPHYPEALRASGIEGGVDLEFVIDTSGRADLRTLRVVTSTHQRFTDAALQAVRGARFVPAELSGRKVLQRVRMPFVFTIK